MDENHTTHKGGERIARAIARAGLASRREAEEWIVAGRVGVNGKVIRSPALDVTARDRITVDGEPLPAKERTRLFLYHKPRGLITTHADPRGRPTIFARLPRHLPRLISVGRLDFNTEGLLLLTNDGALARVLELPATGWLRRYRVRAHGIVTQDQLDALRDGVTISGIHYGAIDATLERTQGSNLWLTFAIREGKNREVRNVLGHLGLVVTRLIRISFGPFQLAELAEGAVDEVRTRVLREQLGAKLIAQAGADFSTPAEPSRDAPKQDDARSKNWRPTSNAWRARNEEEVQKPLLRKFRGARRDAKEGRGEPGAHAPKDALRKDMLTDRKGRRIAVERHGRPPPPEPPKKSEFKKPGFKKTGFKKPGFKKPEFKKPESRKPDATRGRQRRGFDRASGPRPSRPRGR